MRNSAIGICLYDLPLASLTSVCSFSHHVHVKEEPTDLEEDIRSVSLLSGATHSLPLPSDDRDLEEDLPTEDLE